MVVVVYMGLSVFATVATYAVGKWMACGDVPAVASLGLSVVAGMVWPVLLVGIVELGLVAAYSTAATRLTGRLHEAGNWRRWGDPPTGIVIPLRLLPYERRG